MGLLSHLSLLLLLASGSLATPPSASVPALTVALSSTLLSGHAIDITVTLPPSRVPWPSSVPIDILAVNAGPGISLASTPTSNANASSSPSFPPSHHIRRFLNTSAASDGTAYTLTCVIPGVVLRGGGSVLLNISVGDGDRLSSRSPLSLLPPLPPLPHAAAATQRVFLVPGFVSLLPPVACLLCAVLTKMTLVSLLFGIWTGCLFLADYNPLAAFLRTFDTYFRQSFCNSDHAGIVLFTFLLGGLLGVAQRSGGNKGLADATRRVAKTRMTGLLCAYGLGLLIFFDDYSSILIVGSALRPVLSSIDVSPEKGAMIIHALGVNLASSAPVSSWLGVELSYIQAQCECHVWHVYKRHGIRCRQR